MVNDSEHDVRGASESTLVEDPDTCAMTHDVRGHNNMRKTNILCIEPTKWTVLGFSFCPFSCNRYTYFPLRIIITFGVRGVRTFASMFSSDR